MIHLRKWTSLFLSFHLQVPPLINYSIQLEANAWWLIVWLKQINRSYRSRINKLIHIGGRHSIPMTVWIKQIIYKICSRFYSLVGVVSRSMAIKWNFEWFTANQRGVNQREIEVLHNKFHVSPSTPSRGKAAVKLSQHEVNCLFARATKHHKSRLFNLPNKTKQKQISEAVNYLCWGRFMLLLEPGSAPSHIGVEEARRLMWQINEVN